MPTLSEADARRLVEVAFELGRPRSAQELPSAVVALVSRLVAAEQVSLTEVDLNAGTSFGYMSPEEDWISAENHGFGEMVHEHPLITYYQQTGDGRSRCISDFLTAEQFYRRDIYQRFYRRLDAQDQLAATFSPGAGRVVGLTFNRTNRTFSERDRRVVDLIGPAVSEAYHSSRERERLTSIFDGAGNVDGTGALLVDAAGTNGPPQQPRVAEVAGDAPRGLVDLDAERLAAVLTMLKSSPNGTMSLDFGDGYRYQLTRISEARDGDDAVTVRRAPEPDFAEVLPGFGLSPREIDVFVLIAAGSSDRDIARTLDIAPGTVRSHIGRILTKLHAANRTAALAIAHDAVRRARGR